MADFTLDTSGAVEIPDSGGQVRRGWLWSDLSPFAQGYIEAALKELFVSQAAIAARKGHKTHNFSARRFDRLAPSTLAAMLRDCKHDVAMGERIGSGEDRTSRKAGRKFWIERQTGRLFDCPPLTLSIGDDGLIYSEARS